MGGNKQSQLHKQLTLGKCELLSSLLNSALASMFLKSGPFQFLTQRKDDIQLLVLKGWLRATTPVCFSFLPDPRLPHAEDIARIQQSLSHCDAFKVQGRF